MRHIILLHKCDYHSLSQCHAPRPESTTGVQRSGSRATNNPSQSMNQLMSHLNQLALHGGQSLQWSPTIGLRCCNCCSWRDKKSLMDSGASAAAGAELRAFTSVLLSGAPWPGGSHSERGRGEVRGCATALQAWQVSKFWVGMV